MEHKIAQRIDFLVETEKLKSVLRRTMPAHLDRQENSAEHSWSLAVMAMLFADTCDEPIRLETVLEMVAVHDLVEIHAGDTYCYDVAGNVEKTAREQAAADILFGGLPGSQAREFRALWDEFEAGVTAEARFANAIDRMLPLIQHRSHRGVIWKSNGITREQVIHRIAPVASISKTLHSYCLALIENAVASDWLKA